LNKFKSKPTADKSKLNMWAKVVELTEEENVSKMLSAKILDKMRKQKIDEKDDVSDKSKTKKKGGKGAASTKSEGAAISEIQISNIVREVLGPFGKKLSDISHQLKGM
jgi:hypothetical protein